LSYYTLQTKHESTKYTHTHTQQTTIRGRALAKIKRMYIESTFSKATNST